MPQTGSAALSLWFSKVLILTEAVGSLTRGWRRLGEQTVALEASEAKTAGQIARPASLGAAWLALAQQKRVRGGGGGGRSNRARFHEQDGVRGTVRGVFFLLFSVHGPCEVKKREGSPRAFNSNGPGAEPLAEATLALSQLTRERPAFQLLTTELGGSQVRCSGLAKTGLRSLGP